MVCFSHQSVADIGLVWLRKATWQLKNPHVWYFGTLCKSSILVFVQDPHVQLSILPPPTTHRFDQRFTVASFEIYRHFTRISIFVVLNSGIRPTKKMGLLDQQPQHGQILTFGVAESCEFQRSRCDTNTLVRHRVAHLCSAPFLWLVLSWHPQGQWLRPWDAKLGGESFYHQRWRFGHRTCRENMRKHAPWWWGGDVGIVGGRWIVQMDQNTGFTKLM